jgi:DNA modification methylase
MPVKIAEHLIEATTDPGATVLDPMAGSGTTLVAALRLGRRAIGFDRDPLAVLVSRTVTTGFDLASANSVRRRVLRRAERFYDALTLPKKRRVLPPEDQAFIQYWFSSRSQKQLFALARAIRHEPIGPARDLAWTVFSSLIIAKSAGASFALDLPRSRPHKRDDKSIVLPFDGWDRRFGSAILRLPFIDQKLLAHCAVARGDARLLPVGNEVVDLVLTSPPYLTAIDYLRAHKFSLIWMGHQLDDLRELRGTMMGTERGLWSLDGLPRAVEQHLQQAVAEDRRRAQIRQYLSDLRKILGEMYRVLRPRGTALLVTGPSIVRRNNPDAVEIVEQVANKVGFRVLAKVARPLNPLRRSLPPPNATTEDRLAQRMGHEVFWALRK